MDPLAPAIKLNFDGCSLGNQGSSGIGRIFRDELGSCNQVCSAPLRLGDAITTEIKVLLFGLCLFHLMGHQQLIVEGHFQFSALVGLFLVFALSELVCLRIPHAVLVSLFCLMHYLIF